MNIRQLTKKRNLPKLVFVIVGVVAGYGYYYFVGCTAGTCPITGNPYISTVYGGLMGFLIGASSEA